MIKFVFVISSVFAVTLAGGHLNYPEHIPIIGHNGVPLEPAELIHARQAHLAIVDAAKAHHGYHSYHHGDDGNYHGHHDSHHGQLLNNHGANYQNHVVHIVPVHHGFYHQQQAAIHHHASHHVPVIGHNGVPLDTPEVAAARQQHLAALAEANARSHHYGHSHY